MKTVPRKSPLLASFEKHLGPAKKWAGNCYGVACEVIEKNLAQKGSVAVYGHWTGAVHPKSMFFASSAAAFVQHGWVQQPGGTVIDPTRWVFEHVPPYIYSGPADCYDEGGNRFRMRLLGPAPDYDPRDRQFNLTRNILPAAAWTFVERLLGLEEADLETGPAPGVVSYRQLAWLANQDPGVLGVHAVALYAALNTLNKRALVPYDNWAMVERLAPQLTTHKPRSRRA